MFKKILIGLAGFVVLIIVAVLLIPVFVDANKFKPQIEKAVTDNLNADFEIGNIKLSFWGGIFLEIDKMVLSEKGTHGGQGIFDMKNAKLELPFSSVFGGKPDITLSVQNPEINLITRPDGKMNVMKIMKPSGAQVAAQPSSKTSGGKVAVVAFDLSFHIENGHLVYADEKKHSRTDLTGMDLDIKRFGINQLFDISFKTNLKSQESKELAVSGPIVVKGTSGIYTKLGAFDRIDLTSDIDLTDLVVKYGELFDKQKGVPFKIEAKLSTTDQILNLTEVKLIANDAFVTVKGTVGNFSDPEMNLTIDSSKFVFEHWQNILKPLKDFDMQGVAQLGVKVSGPTSKINYGGKVTLASASLKAPGIVPRVTDLRATLNFNNETATLSQAALKMGASDLEFDGTVKNFAKPVIALDVLSKNLDVDALLPAKTPDQEKQAEQASVKTNGQSADVDAAAILAGPIYLMKKNPIMRGMDFTAKVNFKKIVAHKALIENLIAEINFKDLIINLRKATAQTFGGNVQFVSSVDFKGAEPTYQASGDVKGLDINAAISNQMPMAKDTLFGKTLGKFSIAGSGISKPRVKQSLTGTAHLEIQNGSWNSLNAMKQISEKLSGIPIQAVKDQIGKINVTDKFRQLKSDIKIGNGKFNITSLIADMEGPNTTITGTGWVDFDMNNDINGHLITPAGNGIPAKNRTADGRLNLPFEVGCKISSPCLNLSQAFKEIGEGALKDQGVKALRKAAEKIDNPQLKQLLDKLPF